MTASLQIIVFNLIRTIASPEINPQDFLSGFKVIIPLLLTTLLIGSFILVGTILLILPGIYIAVALSFSVHLLLEYRELGLSIWDCVVISEKVVRKKWFEVALFYFLLSLMVFAGTAFVFPFIFVLPYSTICYCHLFRDVFGTTLLRLNSSLWKVFAIIIST